MEIVDYHKYTTRTFFSLNTLLRQLVKHEIELLRICRTAAFMLLCGISPNSLPPEIFIRVKQEQNPDGGWVGADDTMWILLFLRLIHKDTTQIYKKGEAYLQTHKQFDCWGRSERDIARIPVTGRILYFLPQLNTDKNICNLLKLWDKEQNSLTYKAAFTLMALQPHRPDEYSQSRIKPILEWLSRQQNTDGGFGPWKDHPAGSDIFCTAVATIALVHYLPDFPVGEFINNAMAWMLNTQLPNGLWPYHQIEDGASWGLYSLNQVLGRITQLTISHKNIPLKS